MDRFPNDGWREYLFSERKRISWRHRLCAILVFAASLAALFGFWLFLRGRVP